MKIEDVIVRRLERNAKYLSFLSYKGKNMIGLKNDNNLCCYYDNSALLLPFSPMKGLNAKDGEQEPLLELLRKKTSTII